MSTNECSCGNQIVSLKDVPRVQSALENSFVHLDAVNQPLSVLNDTETLLKVAEGRAIEDGIWLCIECLERVSRTMESDIERLSHECKSYDREVKEREDRLINLRKTLCNNSFQADSEGELEIDFMNRIEKDFSAEVATLKQAIEQEENELLHLEQLKIEQEQISLELDDVETNFAREENAIELEAQAMSHTQSQLCNMLELAQLEIEKLVSTDVSLFSLTIDERGLRYPLINELRLAFSPKGDLGWEEIQAAWSQVAQLLLFIDLRQRDWRIIPLTPCAKLINLKSVYNLGKDMVSMAKALKALVNMLESSPSLPYPITRDSIGDVLIAHLPNSDHPAWSRFVHYLACNLQHLLDRAAEDRRAKMQGLLV